jgi:hypothetical protein
MVAKLVQTTTHNTNQPTTINMEPLSPYPPAALPSLSMGRAAVLSAPDGGFMIAAAGSSARGPKRNPSRKRERGGAQALDGYRSIV